MTCIVAQPETQAPPPFLQRQSLEQAFSFFNEAASSLEHYYRELHSEVARLRQQLEQSNQELEKTQAVLRRREALAEMSALLAHEIRNPLASMELMGGLVAESPLNQDARRWLEQMRAGVRLLSATVNNVLQFHGQMSPEKTAAEFAPENVREVLLSIESFLRPLAEQSGVNFELDQPDDEIFIAADKHKLEQVLLNLALNAFRSVPRGGTFTISSYRAGGSAVMEICDTGCGIPSENLPRIFDPGFTTRNGSPGLGLAVCKELVGQHRGSIAVSSIVGKGTTFMLQFPLLKFANIHLTGAPNHKRLEGKL